VAAMHTHCPASQLRHPAQGLPRTVFLLLVDVRDAAPLQGLLCGVEHLGQQAEKQAALSPIYCSPPPQPVASGAPTRTEMACVRGS
jgi:hypothetical protein